MIFTLSVLKPLLKKLACAKGDTVVLNTEKGVLASKENGLAVYVQDDSLKTDKGETLYFPSKKFLPLINRLTGTLDVQITDNGTYKLASSKTKVEMEKAVQTWPFAVPSGKGISVKTESLRRLLSYVQIASDLKQQGNTYAGLISLSGHPDFIDPYIEALGTNGRRVAACTEAVDTEEFSVLLPSTLAAAVGNLSAETTYIHDDENNTGIRSGNFVAVANKFSAKFPPAKALFPDKFDTLTTIDANEFLDALYRIQPMLDENTLAVELQYGESLKLRTIGKGGSGADEVPYAHRVSSPKTNGYTAMFDHRYMLDFLTTVKDSKQPVFLCQKDGADFLVMKQDNKQYLMARMSK